MKFIIYKGQKKFIIDNAWLPEGANFDEFLHDVGDQSFDLEDLQLYELRITATRGMMFSREEVEDNKLRQEIFEGIHWRQETVN